MSGQEGFDVGAAMSRAAAERIRPSAVGHGWGALSGVLTRWAGHLSGDVGARCFPGASPDSPGYIDRTTQTIMLEGDLLSEPPDQMGATLTQAQQAELTCLLGVLAHECGHRNHTDHDAWKGATFPSETAMEDSVLLEEPRMEAHLVADAPHVRGLLGAAVERLLLDEADLDAVPTRETAGRLAVLLLGRVHAGTLGSNVAPALRQMLAAALGPDDADLLEEIVRDVVAIPDGDVDSLLTAAGRYRSLLGEPPSDAQPGEGDQSDPDDAPGQSGEGGGGDGENGPGDGDEEDDASPEETAEQLREAMSAVQTAVQEATKDAQEQPDEDAEDAVNSVAAELRDEEQGTFGRGGLLAGAPSGRLLKPGRRTPIGLERRARRRLAERLRRARARRVGREGSVKPPGRFSGRGAVAQASERARGAPLRGTAFRRRVSVNAPLWAPHVAVAVDTSGSMAPYQAALGSVSWVCHGAVEDLGGRMAVAGFGDGAKLLVRAGRPLRQVPVLKTTGGTALLNVALELCEPGLSLDDRRRPRLALVISDGEWYDDEDSAAALSRLRARGVALVHVGIGATPAEHGADQTVTVTDPLRVADVIGDACVKALATQPAAS